METEVDMEGHPTASGQALSDEALQQDAVEDLFFDKNSRRSSLGADSLFDQDVSDDGLGETDSNSLAPLEAILGLQYTDDIFLVKRSLEWSYHPRKCMADQPQVTEHMRCTLVHWLVKMNHRFKYGPETVFLAVNLADRFLALTPLAQDCLQLLGVTTHFLAAKMEECTYPSISELLVISGGSYKHHHFRRMEILVLSKLEFALYGPTSWYFLDHLALKAAQMGAVDRKVLSVARYVVETCLGSYPVSQFLPSVQGAASMMLALNLVTNSYLSHVVERLLLELYTPPEREDVFVCCSVMSVYMKPFLQSPEENLQPFARVEDHLLRPQPPPGTRERDLTSL